MIGPPCVLMDCSAPKVPSGWCPVQAGSIGAMITHVTRGAFIVHGRSCRCELRNEAQFCVASSSVNSETQLLLESNACCP